MSKCARFVKNSNMGKRLAHVTFDESKRILSCEDGEEFEGLRHHFIRVFSDVLSDEVAPAQVKFQRFDEHFKDYVDLKNEEKVEEDIKVKAIIAPKGKQQPQDDLLCKNWKIGDIPYKWYNLTLAGVVIVNQTYRLWSPVHNAILRHNPSTGEVKCDGSLDSTTEDMIVLIQGGKCRDHYRLIFTTNAMSYVMVGQGEGQPIKLTSEDESPGEDGEFKAKRIGAYHLFRSKTYTNAYLGCDDSKTAILMAMANVYFPNPQALFILNIYDQ